MADINITKSEAVGVAGTLSGLDILGKLLAAMQSIWSDKYGGSVEYRPLKTPANGPLTVTVTTASAEAGSRDFTVYVYYEE